MGKGNASRSKKPSRTRGEAPFAESEEFYVCVSATCGCGRFEGTDTKGKTHALKIKGSLYKRAWVSKGSVCLATPRPELGDTLDIVWVYTLDEVKLLKRYGEIVASFDNPRQVNEGAGGALGDDDIVFIEEETVVFEDPDIDGI